MTAKKLRCPVASFFYNEHAWEMKFSHSQQLFDILFFKFILKFHFDFKKMKANKMLCDFCGLNLDNKDYKKHYLIHMEAKFECPKCDKILV